MKKAFLLMWAVLAASLGYSKNTPVPLSVDENGIVPITVPFAIKSYMPSNKEVIRIEKISETVLRITGRRRGRCDLDVHGDRNLVQKYEITVRGDMASTLENLTIELDSVREVRAQIVGDAIRIDGEVSSIEKWEYLTKVLDNYRGVRNFATFYPAPEIVLKLKTTLKNEGFTVMDGLLEGPREKWPADTVSLTVNRKTRLLTAKARVFTEERRSRLMSCLATEQWLDLNWNGTAADAGKMGDTKAESAKGGGEFKIRAMTDIFIDEPTIRLNIVYFALGENDAHTLGSQDVPAIQGVFSHLQNLVHGGGGKSSATIGATLDTTVRFMADSGISRMSQKGFTLFKSWDKEGGSFKSGGTIFVPVSGMNSGDLKEVPYGFDVKVSGGLRTEKTAEITLDVNISSVGSTGGGVIDQKTDQTKQTLVFPLNKTTVIGGFGQMFDEKTLNGLPILRNTPFLSWFVSEDGRSVSDRRLLFMVYPEISASTVDGSIDLENEIVLPTRTDASKSIDERLEERKRHSGFWSWLDWFAF